MTTPLSVEENLDAFITLSSDITLTAAKKVLQQNDAKFAVVGSPTQLLVSAAQLEDIDAVDTATLGSFFDPPPPVVMLSAQWEMLSVEQIDELVEYSIDREAVGIVVCEGDNPVGILSTEKLASVLPNESIRVSLDTRSTGDSTVGWRAYVCEVCGKMKVGVPAKVGPLYCTDGYSHGPMQLLES